MGLRLPPGSEAQLEVEGRGLRLTSLDRVLWPGLGVTKRDLLEYYAAVAPVMVGHLAGRPLTMARFPHGVRERGFLQNECRGAPAWMRTAALRLRTGATRRYCLVDDAAALLWVVNLGTVELHPYPARADAPDRPLAVLFDLDPGAGTTLLDACAVALRLRRRLAGDDLPAVVKTSGASGLHVAVPLEAAGFPAVRDYARGVAAALAADLPALVAEPSAHARPPGRVMIDWRQNDPRRSTVAPYSLRATTPPGVSMPLRWDEVEAAVEQRSAGGLRFAPHDAADRVQRHGDLFSAAPAALPAV